MIPPCPYQDLTDSNGKQGGCATLTGCYATLAASALRREYRVLRDPRRFGALAGVQGAARPSPLRRSGGSAGCYATLCRVLRDLLTTGGE